MSSDDRDVNKRRPVNKEDAASLRRRVDSSDGRKQSSQTPSKRRGEETRRIPVRKVSNESMGRRQRARSKSRDRRQTRRSPPNPREEVVKTRSRSNSEEDRTASRGRVSPSRSRGRVNRSPSRERNLNSSKSSISGDDNKARRTARREHTPKRDAPKSREENDDHYSVGETSSRRKRRDEEGSLASSIGSTSLGEREFSSSIGSRQSSRGERDFAGSMGSRHSAKSESPPPPKKSILRESRYGKKKDDASATSRDSRSPSSRKDNRESPARKRDDASAVSRGSHSPTSRKDNRESPTKRRDDASTTSRGSRSPTARRDDRDRDSPPTNTAGRDSRPSREPTRDPNRDPTRTPSRRRKKKIPVVAGMLSPPESSPPSSPVRASEDWLAFAVDNITGVSRPPSQSELPADEKRSADRSKTPSRRPPSQSELSSDERRSKTPSRRPQSHSGPPSDEKRSAEKSKTPSRRQPDPDRSKAPSRKPPSQSGPDDRRPPERSKTPSRRRKGRGDTSPHRGDESDPLALSSSDLSKREPEHGKSTRRTRSNDTSPMTPMRRATSERVQERLPMPSSRRATSERVSSDKSRRDNRSGRLGKDLDALQGAPKERKSTEMQSLPSASPVRSNRRARRSSSMGQVSSYVLKNLAIDEDPEREFGRDGFPEPSSSERGNRRARRSSSMGQVSDYVLDSVAADVPLSPVRQKDGKSKGRKGGRDKHAPLSPGRENHRPARRSSSMGQVSQYVMRELEDFALGPDSLEAEREAKVEAFTKGRRHQAMVRESGGELGGGDAFDNYDAAKPRRKGRRRGRAASMQHVSNFDSMEEAVASAQEKHSRSDGEINFDEVNFDEADFENGAGKAASNNAGPEEVSWERSRQRVQRVSSMDFVNMDLSMPVEPPRRARRTQSIGFDTVKQAAETPAPDNFSRSTSTDFFSYATGLFKADAANNSNNKRQESTGAKSDPKQRERVRANADNYLESLTT